MLRLVVSLSLAVVLFACSALAAVGQNRLVNMVPNNRSGETNQDSEPTVTVDPNNYSRIVGSAFTWDNLTAAPNTTNTAPVYVSTDRGATWTLAFIVPSLMGIGFPTGDIQTYFSSTPSGAANGTSWLYGGILSANGGFPMVVLRAQDPYSAALMAQLSNRTGNVDQPHVEALTSFWDGQDRVYVGFNNGFGCLTAAGGRSSTLDVTQDGKVAVPTMTLRLIETRNNACQNGFAQVPAAHFDGTVYTAFIHDWCGSCATPRMTVVRDDNFGTGATPYTALTDPSDSVAGRFIAPAMTLGSGQMGQNRLGASNVAIAVDPRDSDRVYVAWGDSGGASSQTIHVRRSVNRGVDWSADLLTVTNALNPRIAINTFGTVGVLYQRLVSSRWETHLVRTTDADATTFDTPGILLANQSATTPTPTFQPYIGDYASLVAAGKNFMGIFSASNFPNTANFMTGVQYQREVNWATNQLFTNATHTTTVAPSIDPFFFEIVTVTPENDFYVRDWTTNATTADNGAEPSTSTNFYSFSDVWNRRSTSPGAFVNDRPTNEDAGNGVGNIGDNWAFVRVRRNASGPVSSVTAHFLVSRFGTGSNYVDATTMDPNVTFPDPDPVIATDGTAGPWISSAYPWHLNATASTHLCMGVEISSPGDPFVPPTLEGNTPGWSTGTDLRIINDNNKAQRNMHLSTTPASGGAGSVSDWAIVHNADLVKRDIPLQVSIDGISKRYIRDLTMTTFVEGRPIRIKPQAGNHFVLPGVQPGENRWIALNVQTAGLPDGASAFVNVDHIAANRPSSGFAVGIRSASLNQAIRDSLSAQRSVLIRLEALFLGGDSNLNDEHFKSAAESPERYAAFVKEQLLPRLKLGLSRMKPRPVNDPFGIESLLATAANVTNVPNLVITVASLMNTLDAQVSDVQLQNGDVADIVQMVRWQRYLYERQPYLAKLSCSKELVQQSSEFIEARERRKLTNAAYPKFLDSVNKCLNEGVRAVGGNVDRGMFESKDLAGLQKEHRGVLLSLAK